ncbi:MAG: hypothetical protein A3B44_03005 [Candidatus Levybacteria bacterium RIFCSPLOWO2_01_FULL_38_21]|nr:MAG: hypothetical protein A3B44_03005 [Candidatus Levybacteria bacterium RIFCSPLOWO2_01_FULL_38_21]
MKEVKFEESWNKKKVGITLIILLLLVGSAVYLLRNSLFFDTKSERAQNQKVLSASDQSLEDIIQRQVQAIKQQAANINVEEIASSSPQIQNLINDLKALQNLPSSKVKEACFKICSGL